MPDLTIITPVFDGNAHVFFVANRGHHSDIGGLSPGSMPPNSTKYDLNNKIFSILTYFFMKI